MRDYAAMAKAFGFTDAAVLPVRELVRCAGIPQVLCAEPLRQLRRSPGLSAR